MASEVRKNAKAPRILIVDDDPGQRSLLDSFLRSQGFETVLAPSGERALEILRAAPSCEARTLLEGVAPGAKDVIAYAFLNELQSSPLVVSNATQFSSQIMEDGSQPPLTFSFGVAMHLKRPLKL